MDNLTPTLTLYDYWRSSSAYRVRIALNLKGLDYQQKPVHLVRNGGEQNSEEYRRVNPLGLVPALVHATSEGEEVIAESLAICEYLEEMFPDPALLPASPVDRARVRTLALGVACSVQPLNNLAVLNYIKTGLGADDAGVKAWYCHWIDRGFVALEQWLGSNGASGLFCHGDNPGLADCFLVPQVYNAERFDCDLGPYPRIREITARCRELDPFDTAAPENQPDAV